MSIELLTLSQWRSIFHGASLPNGRHHLSSAVWKAMKNSNGTKRIAIKVNSQDSGIYNILVGQISGSRKMLIEPGLTACLLPDGTAVELYGTGAVHPEYLFAGSDIVLSYKVENLDEALLELTAAGARLLGDVETVCSSYKYCHIQFNENSVFGIYEENFG
jgi:hypothetical protein